MGNTVKKNGPLKCNQLQSFDIDIPSRLKKKRMIYIVNIIALISVFKYLTYICAIEKISKNNLVSKNRD